MSDSDKYYGEKLSRKGDWECQGGMGEGWELFKTEVRKGIAKNVTSEPRCEDAQRASHMDLWEIGGT